MAFLVMFYTIFSMQVKEFSTLLRAMSTLWLGMLGELSMTDQLWAAKEWAVPCVILFTFISVFVLLTLIVAIISNAHERMKTADDLCLLREKKLARSVVTAFKSYRHRGKVSPGNGSLQSDADGSTQGNEYSLNNVEEEILPSVADVGEDNGREVAEDRLASEM